MFSKQIKSHYQAISGVVTTAANVFDKYINRFILFFKLMFLMLSSNAIFFVEYYLYVDSYFDLSCRVVLIIQLNALFVNLLLQIPYN